MEKLQIELSEPEALVLFDWLARFNEKGGQRELDPAEERVLFDLEAALESTLCAPLSGEYKVLLRKARSAVIDSSTERHI